ncbi:glycosyltransferase family 4 protein [Nibricoccus aquaticus]|nr:glycosyltransferase family 1 protein [Nibricoccus aquaticus]
MNAPKKIVLVGNFLPDRQESMVRFERALADGFTARGFALEAIRPEPRFVKLGPKYRYGGLPKYLGYLDKFALFPRRLRHLARHAAPGTVFHITDHGNAVYAPHLRSVPLLVSVHDLLQIRSARGEFPQNRIGRSGAKYQEWILRNLARLRAAACISQKTRSDLQQLTGLADASVAVVPMSLNYPYRPLPSTEAAPLLARALARHHLRWPAAESATPPPFLFCIGGAQWYKNRTGLIQIFAALRRLPGNHPRTLVYVGPAFDSEQQAIIDQHCLRESIIRLPGVDNEELRATYSLATGLLFPSWEEGFGWPIAEAQACGCPVFTTHRAPMTEVGGSGATYFDPTDPAAAAAIIAASLNDPAPLRAAGLLHARRWDLQAMLDAYLHLYTLLLENNGREPFPTAA